MRIAIADPPYLGMGKRFYADHPDASEWDHPHTHIDLLRRLESDYDGFVLCTLTSTLRILWPLAAEDVRMGAWVKPWASFKGIRVMYRWEPVLFRVPAGRVKATTGPMTKDWLYQPIATERGLRGAKPDGFTEWCLDLLGYDSDEDTVDDMFPGTGGMGRVAAQGRLNLLTNQDHETRN